MKHYDDELWCKDNENPSYFKIGVILPGGCLLGIQPPKEIMKNRFFLFLQSVALTVFEKFLLTFKPYFFSECQSIMVL